MEVAGSNPAAPTIARHFRSIPCASVAGDYTSGVRLLQLPTEQYRARSDNEDADAAQAEAVRHSGHDSPSPRNVKADQLASEAQAAQSEALSAFQTILVQAPVSYRTHEVRGDAMLAAQKDEAAVAEYEAVLRFNPKSPGVHETLSTCQVSSGRFTEALDALDAERALTPVPSSRLLTHIAQVQHALGRDEEAAAALQNAINAHDAPPAAYLFLSAVRPGAGPC